MRKRPTGVHRLYEDAQEGNVAVAAIKVNDSVTKIEVRNPLLPAVVG